MSPLTTVLTNPTISTASYLGEDLQAAIVESKTINGKVYDMAIATLPDKVVNSNGATLYSYQDDYSSWGYWIARETDASSGCPGGGTSCRAIAQGYWVAGYETAATTIANIPANTEYSYAGNVLGNLVTSSGIVAPIKMDSDNTFNLTVKFGATNPVQITRMKFNTIGAGGFDSDALTTSTTSQIAGNSFGGSVNGGSVTALQFQGKFYGPNAESVGGAWAGQFSNGATTLQGNGVFKARR
ncbi:MAG: hypothetical protein JHC37_07695 [Campylobacteraceae bacterium]|nr:hypothetical protein [Campylobacteraceae bacterium]